MTDRNQKISVALNLQEIMSVIESLPQGHPLLTTFQQKAEVLFAIYKLKFRQGKMRRHEIWCPMSKYPNLAFMEPDNEWCTCLKEKAK